MTKQEKLHRFANAWIKARWEKPSWTQLQWFYRPEGDDVFHNWAICTSNGFDKHHERLDHPVALAARSYLEHGGVDAETEGFKPWHGWGTTYYDA